MKIPAFCLLTGLLIVSPPDAQSQSTDRSWIERSNRYAQTLIDIGIKHSPESASAQGLKQYDTEIGQPTKQDDDAAIAETRSVLSKLKAQSGQEHDKHVLQDIQILIHSIDLQLKENDFSENHRVPFIDASGYIFSGMRTLLDDQVASDRRSAAVIRLRKYTGLEPGYRPLVDLLRRRTEEQIAKPDMIYPSRLRVETELARDNNYVEGIAALFKQYKLQGWEEPYGKLKTQLSDYNDWVKKNLLPKARTDFRLTPEEYVLAFENFGIDIAPEQIATMAHRAFSEIQAQMSQIAAQIAKQRNLPSADYRDVIRVLKREQITGENILPLYKRRLQDLETIIQKQHLVALPNRPARIRIGTPAESVQQPAPHMVPPPFLHNTGEQGEFVLPLNMPAGAKSNESQKVDDYSYDAASWTLIAHEARPGHELQFDSMVEQGVSLTRATFAFNSTNAEGWGLYAEYITLPFMPLEGQLISLQFRLLRAARAFLDPELQGGKIQPAEAMKVLTEDCVFSVPFANQEVERYTFRMPGQANSYFYGYTRLLSLRKETKAALGAKFDAFKFHNFILGQGLLPPDLMRKAVLEDFIPTQK